MNVIHAAFPAADEHPELRGKIRRQLRQMKASTA
jgi:hypothetical protein